MLLLTWFKMSLVITLKVVPFWAYTQLYMMLSLFKAMAQIIFCKIVQQVHRFCLHLFYQQQKGSFEHGLSLEKGRSCTEQDQVNNGRWASKVMFLLAKNCYTDKVLWDGMLSWRKIHPFLHNTGHFLLTHSSNLVRISI